MSNLYTPFTPVWVEANPPVCFLWGGTHANTEKTKAIHSLYTGNHPKPRQIFCICYVTLQSNQPTKEAPVSSLLRKLKVDLQRWVRETFTWFGHAETNISFRHCQLGFHWTFWQSYGRGSLDSSGRTDHWGLVGSRLYRSCKILWGLSPYQNNGVVCNVRP